MRLKFTTQCLFFSMFALLWCTSINAQPGIGISYTVSQPQVPRPQITNPAVASSVANSVSTVQRLGGTLTYGGVQYDGFVACANGWIALVKPVANGGPATGSAIATMVGSAADNLAAPSTATGGGYPLIAPLWDLFTVSNYGYSLQVNVPGIGTNVWCIRWSTCTWAGTTPNTFFLLINPTTGTIRFVYESVNSAVATGSASVGMTGSCDGDYYSWASTGDAALTNATAVSGNTVTFGTAVSGVTAGMTLLNANTTAARFTMSAAQTVANQITLTAVTGISVGMYVYGPSIVPGTTVTAIVGTTITLSANTIGLIPIANGISISYFPPNTTVTSVSGSTITFNNPGVGTWSASAATFRMVSTVKDSTTTYAAIGSGTAFPRPGAPGVNYYLDWTPITPWNDGCSGTSLSCTGATPNLGTITGTCTNTQWNIGSATASTSGNMSCGAAGENKDVWFTVNKPAGVGNFIVRTSAATTGNCGSISGTSVEVFSGTCAALVSEGCATTSIAGTGTFGEVGIAGNSCSAATYYIRVTGDNNAVGRFGICCVSDVSAGSTCANAININSNGGLPFTANCLSTTGTVNNYTNNGCNTGYAGEDMVFTYTVAATECVTLSTTGGTGTNSGIFVFDGCPGTGTCIGSSTSASTASTLNITLTPGTYYFVIDNLVGPMTNFNFSATSSGTGPVNDDPTGAAAVMISPNCLMGVAGTTYCASATNSCGAGLATTACGSYNYNGDVWYTITVPATGFVDVRVSAGAAAPIASDPAMALYIGTCGSFTEVACNDNTTGNYPQILYGGLIPGSTVYVRVWSKTGTTAGSFSICATTCTTAPNDACYQATALTPGATCTYISSTTFCANPSSGVAAPTCGGTANSDVWFSVIVPANGNIAITTAAGTTAPAMTDAAMAIYSGSCVALTQIACNTGSPFPTISLTGQTPGAQLFIRVWPEGNTVAGSFQICATSTCNALDECTSAATLPFSAGATPTYYTFNNACATTSANTPLASCVGTLVRDIWLTVTVPAGATQLTITCLTGTMPDPVMQVYTGTCGALTQFTCNDDAGPGLAPEISLCSVTGGQTLYIRMFPYGGGTDGAFQIAAFNPAITLPNPYQNDDPCTLGSTNVPLFPVTVGCQMTLMSFRCSSPTTQYAGIPAPVNCSPIYQPGWSPSNDIWVRVVVPPGITGLNFNTMSGTYNDDNMVVYRPTNCSTMVQLACDDETASRSTGTPGWMPYISLGGLTPGETLYVRHYPWYGGTSQQGDFYFCVEPACSTTVSNDEVCAALPLTVNGGCLYQGPYTNSCASYSPITPSPTCGAFVTSGAAASRDVWFTVTVPAAGQLTLDVQSITVADAAMAVYSAASCAGPFTQVGCDDNSSLNANMPYLSLTGLTPGATLYVRVWAKNGASGQFNICATDPCPLGTPPNDDPCNAIAMTVGTTYTGYNSCSTNTTDPGMPTPTYPSCWTSVGNANTVWYKFVAPSTSVNIVTTLGTLTNTQIALYQGSFCFSLTPFAGLCNDNYLQCGTSTNASQIIATGLSPGQTYYIMLDGSGNLTGNFGITVYDANVALPATPQQDCPAATVICSPQTTFSAPGFVGSGNYCDMGPGGTAYGCVPATGARENNSSWFAFTIDTTGFLTFDIFPSNSSANFDWVLWNITGSTLPGGVPNGTVCQAITANSQTIAACNYSNHMSFTNGTTGMGSQSNCTNCGTADSSYSLPLSVTAGQTYLMMINNTSGQSSGFTIDFTNTPCVQYVAANPLNWSGGANASWNDPQNWGGCGIPSCAVGGSLLPGLNQPVISGTETVNNLIINPGASLSLAAGATLNICGNFINNGSFNANVNSTVRFIGSGTQFISGNFTGTSRFGNLIIDKASTGTNVTMNSTVEVGGDFSTANATSVLNLNNKILRLYGDFTNAAGNTTIIGAGSGVAGSTVEFAGNTNQVFTNNGSNLILNNVTINQPTPGFTVTITANATSNLIVGTGGALTLNSGRIITGTANEVVIQNTAAGGANSGNNNSYVEGWMRRYFGTTPTNYEFAVGDALYGYERATLNFTTAPTTPYQLVMRFMRWGGSNLPLVNGVYPPLECANYDWSAKPALNHGYWHTVSSTAAPTGTYNLELWNRSQTNYTGTTSFSYPNSGQAVTSNVIPFTNTAGLTVGMNVLSAGIPAGATVTAVTATNVTISVPTTSPLALNAYVYFFTPGAAGRFDALTIMKDTTSNGGGGWKMEALCPCNNTYPPPNKPNSKRYQYNASVSGFSNFATVQFGTQLPIELISFTADQTKDGNICQWSTASEDNNDYFEVERSYDGENFESIGKVAGFGVGTTTETHEYSLLDKDPCNGIVYYRLKQVDIDMNSTTSDVIALNCMRSKDDLVLFPNPAYDKITYSFYENIDGVVDVQLVDMMGKTVKWERYSVTRGYNSLRSTIDDVAAGIYYLKIERMDKTGDSRMVRFTKR